MKANRKVMAVVLFLGSTTWMNNTAAEEMFPVCDDTCSVNVCTPPDQTTYGDPINLMGVTCDVCCISGSDQAIQNGKLALMQSGTCTEGGTVQVTQVSDCTNKVNEIYSGTKLDVCIVGHGRNAHVNMGKVVGGPIVGTGGTRNVLDAESAPFFASELQGKIDLLDIYGCSVAHGTDGQSFIQFLANGLGAIVSGANMNMCTSVLAGDGRWKHASNGNFIFAFPSTVAPALNLEGTMLVVCLIVLMVIWKVSRSRNPSAQF